VTLRDWFEKAKNEQFAIGAFNVDSFDIFKAICEAAEKTKSPVIVEFSPGEEQYFGLKNIADMVKNARDEISVPLFLNLDHAKEVDTCLEAIERGFNMVHFDGSDLPFGENVLRVKEIVQAAHAKDVIVEGEINKVSGASEVHDEELDLAIVKKSYTKPEEAGDFVVQTGVDVFAPVFGNVHGIFPNQPLLDFGILKKVRDLVPNTFLSMHGGSGIPEEQVKEAIKVGGIVKVNVNTELRQAFIDSLDEKTSEEPTQYTYYKMTDDIVGAVVAVVESKIGVFGSGGKL
jgi:fructose-bisphosphate aldolase class II